MITMREIHIRLLSRDDVPSSLCCRCMEANCLHKLCTHPLHWHYIIITLNTLSSHCHHIHYIGVVLTIFPYYHSSHKLDEYPLLYSLINMHEYKKSSYIIWAFSLFSVTNPLFWEWSTCWHYNKVKNYKFSCSCRLQI